MTPFLMLAVLIAASLSLGFWQCQPKWEKSVVSSKNNVEADAKCLEWCKSLYNVMTSRVEAVHTDEYGFTVYNCYCDIRDCGNIIKILP